tara:strand:+ start:2559 stop:2879 length:321 start_codon:yes stop_codon:yes gene_type:complete
MKKELITGLVALVMSCAPTLQDKIARGVTNSLGNTYLYFEKEIIYQDTTILGLSIDKDLQDMTRKELCAYIDSLSGTKGFYQLPSTSKIRMGAQLYKQYQENERGD